MGGHSTQSTTEQRFTAQLPSFRLSCFLALTYRRRASPSFLQSVRLTAVRPNSAAKGWGYSRAGHVHKVHHRRDGRVHQMLLQSAGSRWHASECAQRVVNFDCAPAALATGRMAAQTTWDMPCASDCAQCVGGVHRLAAGVRIRLGTFQCKLRSPHGLRPIFSSS